MAESVENKVENTGAEQNTATESETKTFTQEEVDKLIQAETDRRVNMALDKANKKNAEKLKEAEKLAKMNATEQYEYQLEQREKAIAEKEAQLAMAENKNEASKILAEKGLSLALVEFVVDTDAEEMDRRIKLLDKEFKKSIKLEVEKRLGSNAPKTGVADTGALTKEQFRKLSLSEQSRIAKEDPELYKSFYN